MVALLMAKVLTCKKTGKSNPNGTTTLEFTNSNNIVISGLTSVNSQKFHIVINKCNNVKARVKVSASGNSPNTDGIHVQSSSGFTILNSKIGTGDDCVSIGPGTDNLLIENVACGPGHGISIGSLGKEREEAGVQNVTVKTVTFTGTQNGASGVKISDMTYQDIHGTSATEVAVKFDCSWENPCFGITLDFVSLTYKNEPTEAFCNHAGGFAFSFFQPNSCLV
uniref:Polygalacturonase n=1 Tax=Mangifera indica TaxID=29780 RepID=A0A514YDC5_MANIN|nr:polygalacturonase [Mangifera indica]